MGMPLVCPESRDVALKRRCQYGKERGGTERDFQRGDPYIFFDVFLLYFNNHLPSGNLT